MATTYQKANQKIVDMALAILCEHDTHRPTLDAKVKIDILIANAERDEDTDEIKGTALKLHGVRALGIARILPLKQRAAGRGDAEICIDGDWWKDASEDEQKALLDHELHHIAVKTNKANVVIRDDLNRPKLRMRPHDYQFGWFNIIAQRHGAAAQETQQAKAMMDNAGQFYWPEMAEK